MQRKTIYDVAKEAGVSISTVSRVVNSSGYVNVETRRRVEKACKDYRPIAAAQEMQSRKSRTIGVIINHDPNYFFLNAIYTNVLLAISVVAKKSGFHLLLEINENEEEIFNLFRERSVDGMILMGAKKSSGMVERMTNEQIPFVLIGNYNGKNEDICCVDINDNNAVYGAMQHLLELGHKKIGIVTGSLEYASCSDRLDGYKQALTDAGIPINDNYIQICPNLTEAKAESLTKQMLYQKDRITAMIAFNDYTALAAYKAARDCDLNIPDDLSIIGFDDTQIASYVTPTLTSVWQPSYEKGERAMNLLISALENDEMPKGRVELSCITMLRNSCGTNKQA